MIAISIVNNTFFCYYGSTLRKKGCHMPNADIQISINGQWFDIATYEQKQQGSLGFLEYDLDYAMSCGNSPNSTSRVGLNYPVNFEIYKNTLWPAFLYDVLPSGAGRQVWLKRLGLKDQEEASNWTLLLNGAGNPPGNLRVKSAVITPAETPHRGFSKAEIIDKNANFLEYAESVGAVIAGASDIQGDAPKYMLVRDKNKRWHPDGALPDSAILDSWIVKFPKGINPRNYLILRTEAAYLETARQFGVYVGKPLHFETDALFIPRFDRITRDGVVIRHGLESINSAAQVDGYGKRGDHLEFCHAIARFSTDIETNIYEYLRRDILNTALRNTDNHGRNTAFIKKHDGTVALSPLFDFAPMFLDPDGIIRASIWNENLEKRGSGCPNWQEIAHALSPYLDDVEKTKLFFAQQERMVKVLPNIMRELKIEDEVIAAVSPRCEAIAEGLALCAKRTVKKVKSKGFSL
jgi:serine/threonine-protein kinase HipA